MLHSDGFEDCRFLGYEYHGLLGFGEGGSLREEDRNLKTSETHEKFWAEHHIHKLTGCGGYYRLHLCGSEGNHVLHSYGFEDCRFLGFEDCMFLGSEDRGWLGSRDHWPVGCGHHNSSSGYDSRSSSGCVADHSSQD